MDYYTRYRLMSCNCSRILGRDKNFLTVCMNNYLITPSLKEAILLHGLLCANNTGSLDHLRLYAFQQHGLLLMHCNSSRILGRDKNFLTVCMNNYLITPSLKEAIFLHGLLCSLDHLRLYAFQQHRLLLMHCSGHIGSMFSHGYMVSFLYGILEVGKR